VLRGGDQPEVVRAFVLVDQSSQYRTASDPPVVEIRIEEIRAWWLKL
jgi:hypothetical protein